ncbi:LPXTG cell wall anchor domain-containing protein [Streptomyces sp. 4.24]|uniref:LPXTG cell wall anchor domain-containing protein n=1 Tax=Streptomyces tritrimontium TaxID=3406573 RepID=UPI003BB748D6
MSARTTTLRAASAAAVVAAIAGTALVPVTAQAAEGNPKALKTTMSAPVPSGPLTRGGAAETFELTVANTTDKTSSYHPWMLLDPTGASPLQQNDVVYKVEAVNAPATEYNIRQQDGEWQGHFRPAGQNGDEGFEIAAGAKMTWKVTIGLGASYPTTNGDFTLRASSYANEIAEGGEGSLTFKTGPETKTGKLESAYKNVGACKDIAGLQCREMDLTYRLTGDGAFGTALNTRVNTSFDGVKAELQLEALVDGKWKNLGTAGDEHNFNLPQIPKGFSAASGERVVHLRARLGEWTQVKKTIDINLQTEIGLAEGNTYGFAGAEGTFQLSPATAPTPTAPTTAPASPKPTAPAPTGSATTTPVASATPTAANTPAATGALAHTGSDSNTGLYTGLAGALIALGGAAAWFGARRRNAVRG